MANVHVIIGEDDFLVGETAKKVIGDGVGPFSISQTISIGMIVLGSLFILNSKRKRA